MHPQEFLARGAATLASLRSKKITFKQFPLVVFEYEDRPSLNQTQSEQLADMKQTEDMLTEYDNCIKDVNNFKYEIEKKGGWLTTYKMWKELKATIENQKR